MSEDIKTNINNLNNTKLNNSPPDNILNYSNIVKYGKMHRPMIPFFPQSQIQVQPMIPFFDIMNNPNTNPNLSSPIVSVPNPPTAPAPVPVNLYCNNCGKTDHNMINCREPIISYGLICFYKTASGNITGNTNYDRRTKKNDGINKREFKMSQQIYSHSSHSNFKNKNIIPRVKILKRHESISHTLKNILNLSGNGSVPGNTIYHELNEYDEVESAIDIEEEEIIDMDNEYDNNGNLKVNIERGNNLEDEPSIVNENSNKFYKTHKVILVQRRNTIGFIEFIRGKYDIEKIDYIIKLFNMMTFDEKRLLREYTNFDTIRTISGFRKEYRNNEYEDSKKKFTSLQEKGLINTLLDKSYTKWNSPEWGLPKGRHNNKEYDIDCAIREFSEETGIKYKYLNIYRNVKPLEEIYKGINGVVYKHVYFLASIKESEDADKCIELDT